MSKSTITAARRPDPKDVQLGARIRARRIELGLSQSAVADAIGISFQQLQKYETGVNRIAGGRLAHLADALALSVGALFDEPKAEPANTDALDDEVRNLVRHFRAIPARMHRDMVTKMARTLAAPTEGGTA